MPIIASLIKIAVLSLALLCVDMTPPRAPIETAGDSKSSPSKCRTDDALNSEKFNVARRWSTDYLSVQ